MMFGVEMLGGVPILGIVAAADVSARQTQPQMDPHIAHLETLLTAIRVGLYVPDLI
jgi:hypothetical protein